MMASVKLLSSSVLKKQQRSLAFKTNFFQIESLFIKVFSFPSTQRQCLHKIRFYLTNIFRNNPLKNKNKQTNSKIYLALVRATFVRRELEKNPISPALLDLTDENMMMSSSPPWNPSTDLTFTPKLSRFSYLLPNISSMATTCAA